MTNLIGQSFGRYHILEQLGEGGMATVYKALDTRLEVEVAVKVIRTENLPQSAMERALKRFEREAKALARLTHPNIVKVTDYGEFEGKPFLVMPYLPGGTLKHQLGKPIPWQEAARLLIPVARALDFAHRQGMIHRDVKPSNILITADGETMLTDFGIAKILELEDTVDLTGTSAAVGTPEYMAPEQAVAKTVDHRADIYALGIVLYEMITGRKPYQADTPMAVLIMHARDPLPRPKQFVPGLPSGVENVLLKALAKKPEDRYQNMAEFVHALENLMTGTSARAAARRESHPAPGSSPKQPGTGRSARPVIIAGSIIGLAMIGALLSWLIGRPAGNGAPTAAQPLPPTVGVTESTESSSVYECTDPFGCVEIAPGDPVHIAYWGILSGPDRTLGEDSRRGVQIAIDDLGNQFHDHHILLTTEDAGCTAEGGEAAAVRLAADPSIVALIGSSCSSETIGGIATITNAGLTTISPSNTRTDLTDPNRERDFDGYLRTSYRDAVQGKALADYAYNILGLRRAATIHDGTAYAQPLQQYFADAFVSLGGEVVIQETIDSTATDMRLVLTRIAAAGPDLLYYPIFVDAGGYITAQVREIAGLEDVILASSDGVFTPDFLAAAGLNVQGMILSGPEFDAFPDYPDFENKYMARFGETPSSLFHTHAYDAANIIFAALDRVVVEMSDGALFVPRKALRDAIYATKDLEGMTGSLTCNAFGDCGVPIISIYEVVNPDPASWNPGDTSDSNPRKVKQYDFEQ